MNSAICTLFEGDYHYGVGALANSLYARGYRGTIYAGYRGPLPLWAKDTKNSGGFMEFSPVEGLTLRFIPLTTKLHLTNYKPDFMLEIWENHCPTAPALFYFDPDITIKCRWTFFEEWAQGGVALCEDVNSPMPSSHPLRNAWRDYYAGQGRKLQNKVDIYVNGGFAGVTLKHKGFLKDWGQIQQEMAPAAGNLLDWGLKDRTFMFCLTDQDALNIALMDTAWPYSLSGKDGMDLQPGGGGYIMSHALGGPKPWKKSFIWIALIKAIPPSRAEKQYFRYCEYPIRLYSSGTLWLKRLSLMTAAFLGRFMRRA